MLTNRELSFDELQDVKGVDLMAPVFLAVTNEADDSGFGLQRKCKSIEDLCSNAISQHPIDFFDGAYYNYNLYFNMFFPSQFENVKIYQLI